jgi:hypothetical protein
MKENSNRYALAALKERGASIDGEIEAGRFYQGVLFAGRRFE